MRTLASLAFLAVLLSSSAADALRVASPPPAPPQPEPPAVAPTPPKPRPVATPSAPEAPVPAPAPAIAEAVAAPAAPAPVDAPPSPTTAAGDAPPSPTTAAGDAPPSPTAAAAGPGTLFTADLSAYKAMREAEVSPLEVGRRFLDDLRARDAELWASAAEAVRYQIQQEETEKFARQKGYVLWAYGALWVVLIAFATGVFLRQRRLVAELAALEARVGKEKA